MEKQRSCLRKSLLAFLRKTFLILVLLFLCAGYGLAGSATGGQWAEEMAAFRTEYKKLEGKETKQNVLRNVTENLKIVAAKLKEKEGRS